MRLSKTRFDTDQPYWQDYLSFLKPLAGPDFPDCDQLNAGLPQDLISDGGHAIEFVASDQLADDGYEHRIYTTGNVSTRPDCWHDLFNALVWMRFPRIKTAMNALHYQALPEQSGGNRGRLRDALTLFDECGVIVISDQQNILNALTQRRWSDAFMVDDFHNSVQLLVCGHALLEKYLKPYKSMTAKALLVHVDADFLSLPRRDILMELDKKIARQIRSGELLTDPGCLSPLPLAGVPDWWSSDEQRNDNFYDNVHVFRPAAEKLKPAPIINFTN
jgi:hypothetical protein